MPFLFYDCFMTSHHYPSKWHILDQSAINACTGVDNSPMCYNDMLSDGRIQVFFKMKNIFVEHFQWLDCTLYVLWHYEYIPKYGLNLRDTCSVYNVCLIKSGRWSRSYYFIICNHIWASDSYHNSSPNLSHSPALTVWSFTLHSPPFIPGLS